MNEASSRLEFLYGEALSEACMLERRHGERGEIHSPGRLAYGGLNPALIGCEVIDLSDTGVRVETYVALNPVPQFFSFEFGKIYCRARTRWSKGKEIGLEFIFEESPSAQPAWGVR